MFAIRKSNRNGWVRSLAILGAVIAIAVAGGIVIGASPLGPQAAAAAAPVTIFQTATPAVLADQDTNSVELGLQFRSAVAGRVTGIRFYKASVNTGTHTGSLWTGSTRTRTGTFSNETASGWQTLTFSSPVNITAGKVYTASYLAPKGKYSVDNPYSFPKTTGNLTALKGTYRYGGGYPTSVYQKSNYWVDVTFIPGAVTTTTTAPTTVTSTSVSGTTIPPSSTATPTTTPTPTTTTVSPTTTTTTNTPVLNLPRIPWEGGPAYWAQFPKAAASGWTDPAFFPISVFLGKPSHAAQLKAVGVNTYQGAEHDGSTLASITGTGMFVLAQDEWSQSEVGSNPGVVGWLVSDECEMGYSGCLDSNTEYQRLAVQQGYAQKYRGYQDGRFLQANFGNGVLRTWWGPNTMDGHVALMDVSSVDKYAYTSPHVQGIIPDSPDWPAGAQPKSSAAYGWLQDQMERFQNPAALKPGWVFVETAMPYLTDAGATTITPEQIEGAVWSAIIHEARGIAYFQHNNGSVCGNYSLVDCDPARLAKIAATNAAITALAPVINTQSFAWQFNTTTDTMLKTYNGSAYIFADVGLNHSTGSKSFALPSGITGSTVTVVGENRTLPVTSGKFTDSFAAEYTHHTYRITL